MQWKFKRLTSIVFGMVHSDMTVIVLLHKKKTVPVSDCSHSIII